jgi:nitroreductase
MTRHADHDIDPSFVRRWSPRAMSGAPVAASEVARLIEAARFAPSSGNGQPWRFVRAMAGTPAFSSFHGLLAAGNQDWSARAGALVLLCGKTTRRDGVSPARLYMLDCGAAWMSLALQATAQGLVVHAMEGFDHVKAKEVVRAPSDVEPLIMIAVGMPGNKALLSEAHQGIEAPNARHPQPQFVVDGRFE